MFTTACSLTVNVGLLSTGVSTTTASKLVITTSPGLTGNSDTVLLNQPILTAFVISPGAIRTITLSLTGGTPLLACTTNPVLTNASGLAIFSGCNLTGSSGTYTLTIASGGKIVLSTSIVLTQLPTLSWNTLTNNFGTVTLENYSSYVSFTLSNTGLGRALTYAPDLITGHSFH